jgi:hypothetical protein
MKNLPISLSIAALSLSAVASTASAQPSTEAPASTSGEVSKVDGQIVPVGEQNRYEYDYKKWNVSTNPLGLLLGSYGVSASYAINQRIAIRGDVNYYDPVGDSSLTGFEVGVGAPIYFKKMYNGLFLEPGVVVMHAKDSEVDESATLVGPQALVGYHWYWDSGLNVALAFGVGRNFNTGSSDDGDRSTELSDKADVFANGYLRFGYAF